MAIAPKINLLSARWKYAHGSTSGSLLRRPR
jgi:hypothetical protein